MAPLWVVVVEGREGSRERKCVVVKRGGEIGVLVEERKKPSKDDKGRKSVVRLRLREGNAVEYGVNELMHTLE